MKTENQNKRKQQIEQAAYDLLEEKGYKATSMLAIAKRASASNQTLYGWYGNKQNLFCSLVVSNIEAVRLNLEKALAFEDSGLGVLMAIGPKLLAVVTGDKAITLNRAAATDVYESASLGQAIAQGGREAILPLLRKVLMLAKNQGELYFDGAEIDRVAEFYINVLVGDLQIRRVIGVCPPLSEDDIDKRSAQAHGLLVKVYGHPTAT